MIDNKRVVEIVDDFINEETGKINWIEATECLNDLFGTEMSIDAFRSRYRQQKGTHSKGKNESVSVAEEPKETQEIIQKAKPKKIAIEIGANGTQHSTILVNILEYEVKTPKDILDLHGYDIAQWELVNHKLKVWNTYSKQDGTSQMYSSALIVKPTKSLISSDVIATVFDEVFNKYIVEFKEVEYSINQDEDKYMLEIGLYDVHFGKFAWNKETNNDYDLAIAEKLYRRALDDLLAQAKEKPIEKVLLIFGNDFFHFDNMEKQTTGGTPQDTDTRLHKMYSKGCDLIAETVYKCMEIAPVEFVFVPSNHDYTMGYFASEMIKRVFSTSNNFIHAHIDPKARKYYLYGKVLLGFTHGDKETKDNQLTLMQEEAPHEWAKTRIHEWHKGHFHSEKCETYNSLVMRNFPSITATDLWHYEKGWVKASRKGIAFLWHENGRKTTIESLVELDLKT